MLRKELKIRFEVNFEKNKRIIKMNSLIFEMQLQKI